MEYYGTLGPACQTEEILEKMLQSGMTGIRLNLSHKSLEESREWIDTYQRAAKKAGKTPDLFIDLMGPEIRIGELGEPLTLEEGENVFLGAEGIPANQIIICAMQAGSHVLLDDGKIELEVIKKKEESGKQKVLCRILRGGILSSRKSLAIPGVKMNLPTLTQTDHENLRLAKDYGVTAVMLPFVRNKEDLICLRQVLDQYGGNHIRIFAKIENLDGVNQLEELLPYCDMIVIARGDLGNAVPLEKLPVLQHQIASLCQEKGKPFMVVTQMLHSMISNMVPTRAEVSDIFHAVMDGASSIMLTGETASGAYPVEAMDIFVRTGEEACRYRDGFQIHTK